jgi:putative tryptophan/tyrosine transport system substrate-binding protein
MRRREFITLFGGAAAWPLAARAQQPATRVNRLGVLMGWSDSDPEYQSYIAAFLEGLTRRGWTNGGNLQIEQRWTNGNVEQARAFAKELVALRPNVIFAGSTPVTAALHQQTQTIPIVFAIVSDPVGAGFVTSLAQPGTNITGFINIEASMAGKWLTLLRDCAPRLTQAAIMFNPDTAPGGGSYFLSPFEAAAKTLNMVPIAAAVHNDAEIAAAINSLDRERTGLVIMTDSFMAVHRGSIVRLTAQNSVSAIYPDAVFAREGGLISYGPNYQDMFSRESGYVDRILHGAMLGVLPVQVPTKFDLVINLKTAKALGLDPPLGLQTSADEIIE